MADRACERNPRTCNRVCSNADRCNSRLSVPLRYVAPYRFSPAEFLAEPFRTRRRTVRPTPDSWLTDTEWHVSFVQWPSFTQLCARRNCKLGATKPANQFLVRDELHRHNQAVKIMSHMVEIEIYTRGLREMGKILELNRHLVEFAGLRYKLDTNHDIV